MSLISDLKELYRFYQILQESNYYGTLYIKSRNKYVTQEGTENHGKRTILESMIIDTSKMTFEDFENRLRRISAILDAGLYMTKKKEVVTADSVVLYLNFNSLDPQEAWRELQIKFLKIGFETGVIDVYMSELHKSARFKVHRLDIDTKEIEDLRNLISLIKEGSILMSAETKNGFHVILKDKSVSQELYKFIDSHPKMSMTKNGMMALPGCYQAGHPVKMIDLERYVKVNQK